MNNTDLTMRIFYMLGIIICSVLLYLLIFYLIKVGLRKKERFFNRLLQDYLFYPGLILVFITASIFSLPIIQIYFSVDKYFSIRHFFKILTIAGVGYLVIHCLSVLREIAFNKYKEENYESIKFRIVQTKFQLIQRILNSFIILATIATILMTFESIRNLGTTLLASAGILGVVLGIAAQKSLGTLFSGIQIALAQPIRIGDVVVVEDQFGTIGEISLTFVIVNTWDGRRLIVPVNFFLDRSFETWTRVSSEIIGKVTIHADYSIPVKKVRNEFKKWLDDSELWDKRKHGFLVTKADEKTITLRATMSARNSDDAWDLECQIREKLIEYIQENYPGSLPRTRVVLQK
jgi:small-conductance mechanosensitive channel